MSTRLNPYINFDDNARDAMQFYQSVFGGDLRMNTFKEFQASDDPSEGDKIMHAELEAPSGIQFMGADIPNQMKTRTGGNFAMSLFGDNEAELRAYFEKLCEGGTVTQPLEQAPWGDTFGMLTDKFGVDWMVNISGKQT